MCSCVKLVWCEMMDHVLCARIDISDRIPWRIAVAIVSEIPGLMMSPVLIFQSVSTSLPLLSMFALSLF